MAKEPTGELQETGQEQAGLPTSQKGASYCPGLPLAMWGQDGLVAGKSRPCPTPPTSPLRPSSAFKEGGHNEFSIPGMDLSTPRKFQFN